MASRFSGPLHNAAEMLILSGPPGAGKNTVADALVRGFPFPAVHLHSDDFWGFIKKGLIAPYLVEADAQNRVVIDAVAFAGRSFVGGGYFVVLDGVVGPWFLGRVRDVVDVPLHYVVLRPSLTTTLTRAREGPYNRLKEAEPIQKLHQQFNDLGSLESHVIDTTGQSVSETLEAVGAGISTGAFRLPDHTDSVVLSAKPE